MCGVATYTAVHIRALFVPGGVDVLEITPNVR
jgi:hypothetical protein